MGRPPDASRRRQAIGRSRGGLTSKIMALVDRDGRLVRFTVRPGNAAEVRELESLLGGVRAGEVVADKAYDAKGIRALLASRGIVATIPPRRTTRGYVYDRESYARRHLVENLFATLKHFRGVATRYAKLASRWRALVCLAAWYAGTRSGWREAIHAM